MVEILPFAAPVGGLASCDPLADLASRARAGDRDAYGELVLRLWVPLVRTARAVLLDDGDAEDAAQDALVEAWRRLGALRRPEAVEAWLRRAVLRRALRLARRRPPAVPLEDAPPLAAAAPPDDLAVTDLLRHLPPRQRAVIFLTLVEGRSDREIAALLGTVAATVRVHRHLALRRLRRLLGDRR